MTEIGKNEPGDISTEGPGDASSDWGDEKNQKKKSLLCDLVTEKATSNNQVDRRIIKHSLFLFKAFLRHENLLSITRTPWIRLDILILLTVDAQKTQKMQDTWLLQMKKLVWSLSSLEPALEYNAFSSKYVEFKWMVENSSGILRKHLEIESGCLRNLGSPRYDN